MKTPTFALLAAALSAALMPAAAMAQDGGVIDTTGILTDVVTLVGSLLGLIVMWLARKALSLLGVQEQKAIMDSLRPILMEGVQFAEKRAKHFVAQDSVGQFEIENQKIADAVNYVMAQTPEWRKKLGITNGQVEQWVRALLDLPEHDKAEKSSGQKKA